MDFIRMDALLSVHASGYILEEFEKVLEIKVKIIN